MTYTGPSITARIQDLRNEGEAYRRERKVAGFPPPLAPTGDACLVICWFGDQNDLSPHQVIALLKRAMDEAGAMKKSATARTNQHDAIRTVNAFADAQRPPLPHVETTFMHGPERLPQIRRAAVNHRITRAHIEAITHDAQRGSSHPATRGLIYWELATLQPKISESQPHPDDVFVLHDEIAR